MLTRMERGLLSGAGAPSPFMGHGRPARALRRKVPGRDARAPSGS